ncbi:MAG TPA: hypothetical protein VK821_14085 [Dehalococcoidia bacterium]|nr:hypothetical protein [Dehalococcoidia bacterium]
MPDKFEREIDDILNRLDKFPRQGPADRARKAVSGRVGVFQRRIALRIARLSVGQIMLTGIVMILFGYFFRALIPEIWYYVVILGLILFFTSFALSFFGAGRAGGSRQVYWRGRPAQSYYSSGPALARRLREWWLRRQGRRF